MTVSYGSQVAPLASGSFPFNSSTSEISQVMPVTVGTVTLNSGTPVTVANPNVTATSQILLTIATVGGTVAATFPATTTPGVGFTVNGGASDTSTYNYMILG